MEGLPGSGGFNQNAPFGDAPYVVFNETFTTPLFYAICKTGISFRNIFLTTNQNQQVGILLGGSGSPCGNAQVSFTDTYATTRGLRGEPLPATGGGCGFYFPRCRLAQPRRTNRV